MKFTENYNLKKPEAEDFYNVEDFNENMEVIDGKLKDLEDNKETPAGAQAKVNAHENKAAPHSGHETPAGAQSKVTTHENKTSTHGATAAATPNRIMMRDANGRAKVAAPVEADDIARKAEVDAVSSQISSEIATAISTFEDRLTTPQNPIEVRKARQARWAESSTYLGFDTGQSSSPPHDPVSGQILFRWDSSKNKLILYFRVGTSFKRVEFTPTA